MPALSKGFTRVWGALFTICHYMFCFAICNAMAVSTRVLLKIRTRDVTINSLISYSI